MDPLKWLIKSITFSDGATIPIGESDIVVFVGPNNAGKSQSLKDIFQLCGDISKGTVVVNVETNKILTNNFESWISSFSKPTRENYYEFMGNGVNTSWYIPFRAGNSYDKYFRPFLFNFLKTEDRLGLVSPPPLLNPDSPHQHPIQIIKDNDEKRDLLAEYFHKSFDITIFPSVGTASISLILGSIPPFENQGSMDPIVLESKIREAQAHLPKLEDQGDGMRSFAGITLSLLMPNYSAFFIDEPESFLHPPQAKILGEIIPEMVPEGKQLFIATHSQDFLKGLIEKSPDRVKIIRVTRDGNVNPVKLLDNAQLKEAWKDSFMKYSNLLDSLFHESVVLCESDSDCKIYSMVLDEIMEEQGRIRSVLFTYCGGKQRFAVVAKMLSMLGVDFRIIPDLDFINDERLAKSVYEICGGDWSHIQPRYNDVKSGVESLDKRYTLKDLKSYIEAYIDSKGTDDNLEITKKDIKDFKDSLKYPKGWNLVKHGGISILPHGNPVSSFKVINEAFRKHRIHMPEVGELENFFPTFGNHGPKWADEVMEKYQTLPDEVKTPVKSFIASLNL